MSDFDDNRLTVLDRETLKPVRAPVYLGTRVLELKPHPTDGSVYAIAEDGSVLRVDPEVGKVEPLAEPGTLPADSQTAALSPDGKRFAATNPDGQLQLLDVATWEWYGPASDWGFDIYFAPDGSQFATVLHERMALFDGRTGTFQASIPLPDLAPEARGSPTSRTAAESSSLASTGAPGRWKPGPARGWNEHAGSPAAT